MSADSFQNSSGQVLHDKLINGFCVYYLQTYLNYLFCVKDLKCYYAKFPTPKDDCGLEGRTIQWVHASHSESVDPLLKSYGALFSIDWKKVPIQTPWHYGALFNVD